MPEAPLSAIAEALSSMGTMEAILVCSFVEFPWENGWACIRELVGMCERTCRISTDYFHLEIE